MRWEMSELLKKNRLRDETGLNYLFHFNQTWISLLRGYLDIIWWHV